MEHVTRLRLIGRVTYYLGWIAAIFGLLVHFNIGVRMFVALNISQRNMLEASVLFFLICMASELRAAPKQPA